MTHQLELNDLLCEYFHTLLASSTANGGKRLSIKSYITSTGEVVSVFTVHANKNLIDEFSILQEAIDEYNKR